MRVETIRMVADWLKDEDGVGYGANALLAQVPLDAGDATPPNVTVADSTRDSWVARKEATREFALAGPYLAISLFDPITFEGIDHLDPQYSGSVAYQNSDIAIVIRYVTSDSDSARGDLNAGLTMRAVRGSLVLLNRHENVDARERNGVRLNECMSIKEYVTNEPMGDAVCTGGIVAWFNATDVLPVADEEEPGP